MEHYLHLKFSWPAFCWLLITIAAFISCLAGIRFGSSPWALVSAIGSIVTGICIVLFFLCAFENANPPAK